MGPEVTPQPEVKPEPEVKVGKKVVDTKSDGPGRIAQPVVCLATDVSLTADPVVASSIPAQSHSFVEIDYEIISMVILPSTESFKKDCCQLQAKVCAQSTGLLLVQACPGKSVVR